MNFDLQRPSAEKEGDQSEMCIKREPISPGVLLEHFQQIIGEDFYYVLEINILVFRTIVFRIDFGGSKNIQLVCSPRSLKKQTMIMPFSKETVACLKLGKGWALDFKIELDRLLPSRETTLD